MAKVQHPAVDLGRMANDNGLPREVRSRRQIEREPEGGLAVLVSQGTVWGVVGVDKEVGVGLVGQPKILEKRPMLPGKASVAFGLPGGVTRATP
jgi:hypothetical protein